MPKIVEGMLSASGKRFGVVVSRFNANVTERLLEGALDTLRRHGGDVEGTTVVWVPGAFEIPLATRLLCDSGKVDAVIALGAVIRGSTPHFDYVAGGVATGVAQAMLQTQVPVAFGVLTTDTIEQAVERAGSKSGNKGADAAMTAMEMIDVVRSLRA